MGGLDPEMQARLDRVMAMEKTIVMPVQMSKPIVQTPQPVAPAIPAPSKQVWIPEPVLNELTTINADVGKPKKAEPEILTVSDLNRQIKSILEKTYPFIWVKGEISNFKVPASGHFYFTLKDAGAQIKSVMFKGFSNQLKFRPEDGMEVLVRARVTVYEPRGDYQLFCEVMEPVGYGALQVAFEKLKAMLQKEGLFDISRKKQLPSFPQKIGLITSPTGAAIKDMLNVLGRRFGGGLDITIMPTSVQGDKAPREIAQAVRLAHKMGLDRFDVLIVGRGGGSLEDLWAFNTEEVARAVSECCIPIISAVGHEVDFTICDFVADLRAPTPSAAAELVVKNKADLSERVKMLSRQMTHLIVKKIQHARANSTNVAKRLIDPKRRLQDLMLRCDEWTDRLLQSMQRFLSDSQIEIKFLMERIASPENRIAALKQKIKLSETRLQNQMQKAVQFKGQSFTRLAGKLDSLSPLAVLDRGYSIIKKEGHIIKDMAQLNTGDEIELKLSKGQAKAKVL